MGHVVNIDRKPVVRVVGVDPSLKGWGMVRAMVNLSTLKVVNIDAMQLVVTEKDGGKRVSRLLKSPMAHRPAA